MSEILQKLTHKIFVFKDGKSKGNVTIWLKFELNFCLIYRKFKEKFCGSKIS